MTVEPEPTTEPPAELTALPGVTDAIADVLAEDGPQTIDALARTDPQRLDELAADDRVDDEFVERVRALQWWHRGEAITFPNRGVVDRRRERAADGYRSQR